MKFSIGTCRLSCLLRLLLQIKKSNYYLINFPYKYHAEILIIKINRCNILHLQRKKGPFVKFDIKHRTSKSINYLAIFGNCVDICNINVHDSLNKGYRKDTCWRDVHLEGYETNQTFFCFRAHNFYCLLPVVGWCSTVDWCTYLKDPLSSLLYHDHDRSAVKAVSNRYNTSIVHF